MKKDNRVMHSMQGVFVFLLLGIFALMSTLLVLLGAQMYRGAVDKNQFTNDRRAAGAYLRSMIRYADGENAVSVEERGGTEAVALREEIEGVRYVTWLYSMDGQLWEQFSEEELGFDHDLATAVCPMESMQADVDGQSVVIRFTDENGEEHQVVVALRCAAQR